MAGMEKKKKKEKTQIKGYRKEIELFLSSQKKLAAAEGRKTRTCHACEHYFRQKKKKID